MTGYARCGIRLWITVRILRLLSIWHPGIILKEMSNKQLKELILKYTDELTPRQRLVFMLRDVEELEVEEVRQITGLSAGKIKTNLYLARKNIRNKMNQTDPDL